MKLTILLFAVLLGAAAAAPKPRVLSREALTALAQRNAHAIRLANAAENAKAPGTFHTASVGTSNEILDALDPSDFDLGQPFTGFTAAGSNYGTGYSISFGTPGYNVSSAPSPVVWAYDEVDQIMILTVGTNFNWWNATHDMLCFVGASPIDSLSNKCYYQLGGIGAYAAAYGLMGLVDIARSLLDALTLLPRLIYQGLIQDLSSPQKLSSAFKTDPVTKGWVEWIFTEIFCLDILGPNGSDFELGSILTTNILRLTHRIMGRPPASALAIPAEIAEAFANPLPVSLIQLC